jgi:hypothetical protein
MGLLTLALTRGRIGAIRLLRTERAASCLGIGGREF